MATLRDSDRLYLIADSSRLTRRGLEPAVCEALASGVTLVQLREKRLDDDAYRSLAMRLRSLTRDAGARLLFNGRASLASEIGADGVHLPANASARVTRDLLRDGMLCGVSVHNADELRRAEDERADFVTLSPVYATTSKPDAPALGPDRFALHVSGCRMPVYALGGVTPERVAACLDAGAFGVAVVNGILDAPNVADAVRRYFHALRHAL
jgi:thiamine-phosphate pyrophosphorylase